MIAVKTYYFKRSVTFLFLCFISFVVPAAISAAEPPNASVLVCFVTTACEDCHKAEAFLDGLEGTVPLTDGGTTGIILRRININEGDASQMLLRYFTAYHVPDAERHVPIVFYAHGYLSGHEAIENNLEAEIGSGKALGFSEPRESGESIAENQPSIPIVLMAGLLGGVNPCSVSMLLLLLSLLAGKSADIAKIGFAYLLSKVLTYLGLGLGLYSLISVLDSELFRGLLYAAHIVMAVLALGLAALNIRDFINARRERYGKIFVQLPKSLRGFNERLIKEKLTGEGWLLALAAFALGAVISAGEFLCTGQVYLATILYVANTGGSAQAVFSFLLYVAAMAVPPALLIILCAKGKKTLALSEFVRRRLPAIKLANAALFLAFAAYMAFSIIRQGR